MKNKIFNLISFVLAIFGFFVSFGLALHMKWFLAVPSVAGLLVLGIMAYPKIKEAYDKIFNG